MWYRTPRRTGPQRQATPFQQLTKATRRSGDEAQKFFRPATAAALPPRPGGDEPVADHRKDVRATVPVARPPIGTPDDGRSGPGNFYTTHGT